MEKNDLRQENPRKTFYRLEKLKSLRIAIRETANKDESYYNNFILVACGPFGESCASNSTS